MAAIRLQITDSTMLSTLRLPRIPGRLSDIVRRNLGVCSQRADKSFVGGADVLSLRRRVRGAHRRLSVCAQYIQAVIEMLVPLGELIPPNLLQRV
jgi:hypothetical protein